jgi:hypothetical protein
MSEHTPTPWLREDTTIYFLDWDGESYEGKGATYRQMLTNRFSCGFQGHDRRISREELLANAEFAHRAVNNHDALVTALEKIILRLERCLIAGGSEREFAEAATESARAALTSAQGLPVQREP